MYCYCFILFHCTFYIRCSISPDQMLYLHFTIQLRTIFDHLMICIDRTECTCKSSLNWSIDYCLHPASSISDIFRTRTSSTQFIKTILKLGQMGQPRQQCFEKYRDDIYLVFCSGYNSLTLFQIYKRSLMCMVHSTLQTCWLAFHIITWHWPSWMDF